MIFRINLLAFEDLKNEEYASEELSLITSLKSTKDILIVHVVMIQKDILEGHFIVLHDCVALLAPSQPAPPFWGAGLSQLRMRVCVPPSHDCVHVLQLLQTLQPPLTERRKDWNNKHIDLKLDQNRNAEDTEVTKSTHIFGQRFLSHKNFRRTKNFVEQTSSSDKDSMDKYFHRTKFSTPIRIFVNFLL